MTDAHSVKGHGYLLSIVSVFLLAYPSLKSAKGDWVVIGLVLAGAALSIAGMAFRWVADRKTQRKIDQARHDGEAALGEARRPVPGH